MISTCFGMTQSGGFAEAIVYGADHGAHISSNSWAYSSPNVWEPSVLAAIDYATSKGVLVVFAAGNDGEASTYYPAFHPNTLAVAAVDSSGVAAPFTTFGTHVSISAPGVDVVSTACCGANYSTLSGTSFAVPHVAGALALALGYAGGPSAAVTPQVLKKCLKDSATDISALNSFTYRGKLGAGLLNARGLLECAKRGGKQDTTTTVSVGVVGGPSLTPRPTLNPTPIPPLLLPSPSPPTVAPSSSLSSLSPSLSPFLSLPSTGPSQGPSTTFPSSAPTGTLLPADLETVVTVPPQSDHGGALESDGNVDGSGANVGASKSPRGREKGMGIFTTAAAFLFVSLAAVVGLIAVLGLRAIHATIELALEQDEEPPPSLSAKEVEERGGV